MTGVTNDIARRQQLRIKSNGFKPAKKWSHQAELESLKGRMIDLRLNHMDDDAWLRVKLIEADQFAIKIDNGQQQSTLTYFKHQIAAFAAA